MTFFCELEAQPLQQLFSDPAILTDLAELQAGLSLGILDLSAERAEVVRSLNAAGIPVTAWLLLPKEQGYWFNTANAPQAAARYAALKAWTAQNGLQWNGIGVDIEPDIRQVQEILHDRRKLIPLLANRLLDHQTVLKAQMAYAGLITTIQTDGYRVESYHIPFITDERKAGSTLLRRLLGLVDVSADREVHMLYTSFLGSNGAAILASYAPESDGVGIGNTGGGVELPGVSDRPPLSWEDLARDLRLAHRSDKPIYIFCLEGCVKQGYLERLKVFDWKALVKIDEQAVQRVSQVRRGLQAALWISAHPLLVLATLAVFSFAFGRTRRR